MTTFYAHIATQFGQLLALSDGTALTGLYFVGQKHEPAIEASWQEKSGLPLFAQTAKELNEYANHKRTTFNVSCKVVAGTPFQKKVWTQLNTVSYGATKSYSDMANMLGAPQSVRAIATAIGKNPLSIIIPCHRIIGSNGNLTGYAGGIERKKMLLTLEQQ